MLQLNNELAQGALLREKLLAERLELVVRLHDAQRQDHTSKYFKDEFVRSVRLTLADEEKRLQDLKSVLGSYKSTAPQILSAQDQYLPSLESESEKLYKAHLIDEQEYLGRKHKLSQLTLSGLSLQKDGVELQQVSGSLDRAVQSYNQLLRVPTDPQTALSFDVLRAKKEHDSAFLEKAKAEDLQGALQSEIAAVDRQMARQDLLLDTMRRSPYLRAFSNELTVASLPYENESAVRIGAPIYGCSLEVLWCHPVGHVAEIFPGEVVEKHPFYNRVLRGMLIRTQIENPYWARKRALFLNRAPLLF